MPKNSPVKILAIPEKTRVLEREIVPFMDSAMAMGRKVPRSPSEPDISVMGWDLRMCRFRAEMSRKELMKDMAVARKRNSSRETEYIFSRCMNRNEDRKEDEELRRHYVVGKLAARDLSSNMNHHEILGWCLAA